MTIPKMTHMKEDNSTRKQLKTKQFWKGNIRTMTILNRKHWKHDNSEKDKSEKEKPAKTQGGTGQI